MALKQCLIRSSVLAFPDFQFKFLVDVDASGTGLGTVLLSQEIGGKEKVVAYASRSLNKPKRKYCATIKEMLATYLGYQTLQTLPLRSPFYSENRPWSPKMAKELQGI